MTIKVISRSRSFIASVWISIPKRAVGLRPNAFLYYVDHLFSTVPGKYNSPSLHITHRPTPLATSFSTKMITQERIQDSRWRGDPR